MYDLEELILLVIDFRRRRQTLNLYTESLTVLISHKNWLTVRNEISGKFPQEFLGLGGLSAHEFILAGARIAWSPAIKDGDFVKGVYDGD